MSMTYTCPVCGYPGLDTPPRDPVHNYPSYDICPSCGFEYGFDDDSEGYTYETYRQKWLADGAQWWAKSKKPPAGWDPVTQLMRLDEV
jgi:rubredoxin